MRFINADRLNNISSGILGGALYLYCSNNPIARKDTSGDVWETIFDVGSLAASVVEVAINPGDVWAWAGLVGDTIDLIPYITGCGEAIKTLDRFNDIDNVIDSAKALKSQVSKSVGVYEIEFASGKNYVGKGPFSRAIQSAIDHSKEIEMNEKLGDTVISIRWREVDNDLNAFIEEYALQVKYSRFKDTGETYNRIWSPGFNFSKKSLQQHIEYININHIEKAVIIADNIDFITNCPSLKHIEIYPANTALDNFDYSPLYKMPEIKSITCSTQYGSSFEEKKTTIDYSKIKGLKEALIYGEGHLNIDKIEELEVLIIKNSNIKNLYHLPKKIKKLWIWESKIESFDGISEFTSLQYLALFSCKKISNISEISNISSSLRALCIDKCNKIEDFSCLSKLINLESLTLNGSNILTNLSFILEF